MGDTTKIVIGGATINRAGLGLGYIKDGVTITPAYESYKVDNIQGMTAPVSMQRTKSEYLLKTTIVEPVLDWAGSVKTIKWVWDLPSDPYMIVTYRAQKIEPLAKPAEAYWEVTGLVPTLETIRTIRMYRGVIETPGEYNISDQEESKVPITVACLYRAGVGYDAIGQFSDAQT